MRVSSRSSASSALHCNLLQLLYGCMGMQEGGQLGANLGLIDEAWTVSGVAVSSRFDKVFCAKYLCTKILPSKPMHSSLVRDKSRSCLLIWFIHNQQRQLPHVAPLVWCCFSEISTPGVLFQWQYNLYTSLIHASIPCLFGRDLYGGG